MDNEQSGLWGMEQSVHFLLYFLCLGLGVIVLHIDIHISRYVRYEYYCYYYNVCNPFNNLNTSNYLSIIIVNLLRGLHYHRMENKYKPNFKIYKLYHFILLRYKVVKITIVWEIESG